MALGANTIWEVELSASDTNGGGFNPATAGIGTADLTVTGASGQNAAPTVSSATYTFVAGDVNAWLFIKSGSTFIPGWYKITAVAGGVATLDATSGHAAKFTVAVPVTPSTVQGCSTATTGTVGVFTIDYSQQTAAFVSVTDAVTAGTTTITSATANFTKVMIGNLVYVQGGTGSIAAGWYEVITNPLTTSITVDRSTGLTAGTGVTLKLGGALTTMGQAGANKIAGNDVFMLTGTYTLTGTTVNTAGCQVSDTTGGVDYQNVSRWESYGTYRGDKGTKATWSAGAQTSVTLFTSGSNCVMDNMILDCNNGASNAGWASSTFRSVALRVKVANAKGLGFSESAGNYPVLWMYCEATNCQGAAAFSATLGGNFHYCEAWDNTTVGFAVSGAGNAVFVNCIADSNTGASSDGFVPTCSHPVTFHRCVAYGNGRHGFNVNGTAASILTDCLSETNGGHGYTATAGANPQVELWNCGAYNNTSSAVGYDATKITLPVRSFLATPTGSFFTNAAASDFSLTNTANQGALARAAGFPTMPHATQTGYPDVGAVQHQDAGAAGMLYVPDGGGGGG